MVGIERAQTSGDSVTMERIVRLHIEKLPEGVYLAVSDDVPGLVAQGRTVTETLEIARDVARRLLEEQGNDPGPASLPSPGDAFDYPLVIAA